MKLIAISQRQDTLPDRNETRDALDQALNRWVVAAGFLPVPVPNALSSDEQETDELLSRWLASVRPAGLVLSGGNDIGSTPLRDHTEASLLTWARQNRLPVLGICRGMQLMGVLAGSRLVHRERHAGTRHPLTDLRQVNSYHHYALADLPDGFLAEAHALDGTLEAMRHVDLPWLAWMWHPEREAPFDPADLSRFRTLFQ